MIRHLNRADRDSQYYREMQNSDNCIKRIEDASLGRKETNFVEFIYVQ